MSENPRFTVLSAPEMRAADGAYRRAVEAQAAAERAYGATLEAYRKRPRRSTLKDREAEGRFRELLGEGPSEKETAIPNEDDLKRLLDEVELCKNIVTRARDHREEIRRKVSPPICRKARPGLGALWRKLAEAMVTVSETSTEIRLLLDELEVGEVAWTGHLPVSVPLARFDARDPGADMNRHVSEILRDWELSVPRPILADAEKRRKAEHMEREKRKARERKVAEKQEADRMRVQRERAEQKKKNRETVIQL
ncbi:hypothetical protein ACFL3S_02525 [Gemmatimonadota bacterium]